jgi:uncharacterized protein (DUF362 family)/Pyruvate/2-oxoacid:ferredoxin oxidoreductase delta subunit
MSGGAPRVALASCEHYGDRVLDLAVAEVLDELPGWQERFAGDPVVLIKPNLLRYDDPSAAVTTHPAFVVAVVRAVRRVHSGRMLLGDSPQVGSGKAIAQRQGLTEALQPLDVEVVDFDEAVTVGGDDDRGPLELARPLAEADVVVNLPKLKTHCQMGLTGAVKNLFGAVLGLEKTRMHLTGGGDYAMFAALLLDIALRTRAQLHIADGIVAMEGNGPGAGKPRRLGLVAASTDMVALDRVFAEIVGFPETALPLQQEARRRAMPGASLRGIELRGAPLSAFPGQDWEPASPVPAGSVFIPGFLAGPMRHQLTTRPLFAHARCTRCGQCIEHCAAGALSLERRRLRDAGPARSDRAIRLELDRCIRCYCCQEVCPEGAVRAVEGALLRLSRLARLGRRTGS